ncbi:recombinase family protein [Neglectibacter timonensis]|uniref:recombinase family protein n=1 Tax=Neglectibacter timonensis TaxID=1776382 RepID=UPI0039922DDF
MNNRIDAIYARQSVDKKDSISIESQIEFCKYELKRHCCEYWNKGTAARTQTVRSFKNWCGTSSGA